MTVIETNRDPGDTLETPGVLGKIKAQLRANVYISLEESDNVKNKSKWIKQCAQTSEYTRFQNSKGDG